MRMPVRDKNGTILGHVVISGPVPKDSTYSLVVGTRCMDGEGLSVSKVITLPIRYWKGQPDLPPTKCFLVGQEEAEYLKFCRQFQGPVETIREALKQWRDGAPVYAVMEFLLDYGD